MDGIQNVSITPWFSQKEWVKVAYCIVTGTDPVLSENHFRGNEDFEDVTSNDPVNLFLMAIQEINIWKARTNKLAAGIETTLCLLHGAIAYAKSTENSNYNSKAAVQLCLATAINRFLNLICHTGFNLFGLTKYYDVAEKFSIPDWIVEVRHETAHGHMPSEELLLDALAFSLRWIVLNYWVPEYKNIHRDTNDINTSTDPNSYIKNTSIYNKINKLLDCYRYLKLYTIWGGVQKVSDLKDQAELYEHVIEHLEVLLPTAKTRTGDSVKTQQFSGGLKTSQNQKEPKNSKKKSKQFIKDTYKSALRAELDDLRIGSAMNLIQDKIHSIICSLNNRQGGTEYNKIDCHKSIITNLVYEELMLPSREFFNSLADHDSSDNQSSRNDIWTEENLPENLSLIINNSHFKPMKLPKDLVHLWADILRMIAANGSEELLSDLLYTLHEASGDQSTDSSDKCILQRCLASAWISEICESLSSNISMKTSLKDAKPKKQSKNQKERTKENRHAMGILKLNSFDVTARQFQEIFCRQVLMNPLTSLTIYHLQCVLSLTLTKSKTFSSEQTFSSVVDEQQKKRILQVFCALYGIKENVPKSSALHKVRDTSNEVQTVNSMLDHIQSLKRSRDDAELDDSEMPPSKITKNGNTTLSSNFKVGMRCLA